MGTIDTKFPRTLDEFVGQKDTVELLRVAIYSAQDKIEPLAHTLFCGSGGLGKSKLAWCIAETMGVPIKFLTGGNIRSYEDVKDVVEFINNYLQVIVFIDEVHAFPKKIEEMFFPIMQDFNFEGEQINRFTMIGATTDAGDLVKPLRDRFTYTFILEHYSPDEIQQMLMLRGQIEEKAAALISTRAFGIPRIGNNYLKICDDRAYYNGNHTITTDDVIETMNKMGVDELGLDKTDRKILVLLAKQKIAMGLESLAVTLDINVTNLKEIHERKLMQLGFLHRTSKGRALTTMGQNYLQKRGDI